MLKHIFKLENRIMLNAVSPVPEILVISEGVNDYADLAAAVDENVEVITYDPDTDNLTDLLADIGEASDGSIDVISFATHDDGSGGIQLTAEETVTAESLNTDAEQQAFFNGLADLMTENGRIDFLACSVADSVETSVESFVGKGINVAISNDITGNSGDWMLESDGIDLTGANGYFDANALEAFTGSMNTTTTSVTTGKTTVTYVDADSEASAIVIDLSLDPNASRDITFHNGAGSDERVHISSTAGDPNGAVGFYSGVVNTSITEWDQATDPFALINEGAFGTFNLNGTQTPVIGTDGVSSETTTISLLNDIIEGTTYTAPTAGGIYAVIIDFDSTSGLVTPDRNIMLFVKVIPYVTSVPIPDYIPLDVLAPDTLAADLTNMQLNYNPLDILGPQLPNVAPLEIYQGSEFASVEVASLVSISERDMESSYFADGGTPLSSKIASAIDYSALSMGVPDFLTQPEINSVIYLNAYQDTAKVYGEPNEADVHKLGYYPANWEITESDGSGYYIKIEDNIYYINLKSPVECCGTRVSDFTDGLEVQDPAPAPIENDFISRHLEHLKKTGKGVFNNFKKVSRY